jgi:hypothetical protein
MHFLFILPAPFVRKRIFNVSSAHIPYDAVRIDGLPYQPAGCYDVLTFFKIYIIPGENGRVTVRTFESQAFPVDKQYQ